MDLSATRIIHLMLATALLVCTVMPASAAWQDPTAGWEAVYDAASNQLPWQLSGTGTNKIWTNQIPRVPTTPGFLSPDPNIPNYAGVVTDEATGQLAMEMNTTGVGNAIAALQVPPGSGTNADLLTIDFKFRLFSDLPAVTAYGSLPFSFPLLMTISRPPTPGQIAAKPGANEQFWQFRFRKQSILALGANSSGGSQVVSGSTQLSNVWHDLRFQVDVSSGAASIYLDGSDIPDITNLYARTNVIGDPSLADNTIYFGTAGTGIHGVASVEYVKITTSELAPVTGGGLVGDLNSDGFVGVDDLNIVLINWNQNVTPGNLLLGDATGEGFVGVDDLNVVLVNWNNGTPPAPGAAIPEPASLALLGLGGLVILRRKS